MAENEIKFKKKEKKIDSLTTEYYITIKKDILEQQTKEELKKIQIRVKVDGFRQGQAPMDLLNKQYGDDAFYRGVNSIIKKAVDEILDEEKVELAISPEVNATKELKRGEDAEITVSITKKPTVPAIKFEKIEVENAELEMSEKDKEEELKLFQKRMSTPVLDETDKKAEMDNMVEIDFVGKTLDGVEFPGGSAKGYKLELGSHSFIEGFEEQIVGHKKGETFDIKVKFPDVYHSQDLQGKEAIFTITLNAIYNEKLPELNDELAKSVGFESMDKIKELLFSNKKNIFESQLKSMLKNKIFDKMIEITKFDLPETIIEKEIKERLEQEKARAEQNKAKFDEKSVKKDIDKALHKSYSSFYITDYIAKSNAVEVSDDEIKQVATQDAIRAGMDVNEVLKNIEKNQQMKNQIAFLIKESKVFDIIFDKINKKTKKLDCKGFNDFLEKLNNELKSNKK